MIPTEPGMYWTNHNQVVKVQPGRQSGRMYGKILVIKKNPDNLISASFEYKPGLLTDIERRMTAEEAEVFGKQFGICCACGRLLTNELSIELGIGPICRARV